MKHVSILVPKGDSILSSVVGPFKILMAANQFLKTAGIRENDFFELHLVGLDLDCSLYHGLFSIHCDSTINEVKKTDLILIPALRPDKLETDLHQNKDFIPWILNQRHQHKAEVASMCMGAFLLAQTGLVNGKQCSTHWAAMQMFRNMFPQVNLVSSKNCYR